MRREANQSLPSSSKVELDSIPPHVYVARCLFVHRDNLKFMITLGSVRENKAAGTSGLTPPNNTGLKNSLSLYLGGKGPPVASWTPQPYGCSQQQIS
jgi:hypothetical protein